MISIALVLNLKTQFQLKNNALITNNKTCKVALFGTAVKNNYLPVFAVIFALESECMLLNLSVPGNIK